MILKLFEYAENKVQIYNPAIMSNTLFKELFDSDTGSTTSVKGNIIDSDKMGENKSHALRQLSFFWHYCWIESPHFFETDTVKIDLSKKSSGLNRTIVLYPSGIPFEFNEFLLNPLTKEIIGFLNRSIEKHSPTFGIYREYHKTLTFQLQTLSSFNRKLERLQAEFEEANESLLDAMDIATIAKPTQGPTRVSRPKKEMRSADMILEDISKTFEQINSLNKNLETARTTLSNFEDKVKNELGRTVKDNDTAGMSLMETFRRGSDRTHLYGS